MLIALGIIFIVLLFIVGGDRGVGTLLALVFNVGILLLAIKLITYGINPFLVVIPASLLFAGVTLLYQNGVNIKSVSSFLAVLLVMGILAGFILVVVNKTRMAGYSEVDQYEEITMYLSTNLSIRMDQVMSLVVLLGLLGAIMDTSIAITTAVYEVHRNNQNYTMKELIHSGKNVGRDIMGTTVNTLFLAGIGDTIMLNILYLKYHYSITELLNSKSFFQEFGLLLFSNIGCLLIIPISYYLIGYLLTSQEKFPTKVRAYCRQKEEEAL